MINVKNYNAARNVANFIVDSVDEIALLPDLTKGGSLGLMDMGPVAMGSTVMIPTTGAVFMLNGNNVYTQIGAGGGGGSANAVLYTPQTLTDAQKLQARTNIGAGTGSGGDVPDNVVLFEETPGVGNDFSTILAVLLSEKMSFEYTNDGKLQLYYDEQLITEVTIAAQEHPCVQITIVPKEAVVEIGKTKAFSATVLPTNCTDEIVFLDPEDEDIATSTPNGVVTGVSEGTTTMDVCCGTKTDTATLYVVPTETFNVGCKNAWSLNVNVGQTPNRYSQNDRAYVYQTGGADELVPLDITPGATYIMKMDDTYTIDDYYHVSCRYMLRGSDTVTKRNSGWVGLNDGMQVEFTATSDEVGLSLNLCFSTDIAMDHPVNVSSAMVTDFLSHFIIERKYPMSVDEAKEYLGID